MKRAEQEQQLREQELQKQQEELQQREESLEQQESELHVRLQALTQQVVFWNLAYMTVLQGSRKLAKVRSRARTNAAGDI